MRITSFLKLYVIAFSLLLWGYNSESKAQALPQSKSSAIIGGNDGPTAIYIGDRPDFLLREGLDMVRNMCTLANDTNYIKYSTNNPAIIRLIKDIDPNAFVSQSAVIGVFGEGFDRIKVK